MKLSTDQKQEIVNKIKASKTFSNARTSSSLLQYLHDSTLKGANLKEEVIDIEFYGKSEFTDKNNPRVRVNVYNLRKKLNIYYEEEGKNEKWKLYIDKGQYKVSFERSSHSINIKQLNWSITLPYVALSLAILFIIISNIPHPQPQLWKPFLSSENKTSVYVGDVFGTIGPTITGRKGWTRDYGINSFSEFYGFIKDKPELNKLLEPSPFTLSTSMSVLSIQQFQKLFQYHNEEFSIRFSTRTSTSEIKEGNAIYIGMLGNKNKFISFFNEANPNCKINRNSIDILDNQGKVTNSLNPFKPGIFEEYALVSKYKTPDKMHHFVFFSQHDMGVTATVDFFTNEDSLKSFTSTHLDNVHQYFTAIFSVKGQDRTNTSLQLDTVLTFN